ncbi:hypothetical protein [Pseudomonas zeae]|uniref:hypothetical protein n=1 Tax=Pseudomonas zeae TaxID=2745510 RepID=UPI0039E0FD82
MNKKPTTKEIADALGLTTDQIGGYIASTEKRADGSWLIYLDMRIESLDFYEKIRSKLKGFYTYEM